MEGLTRIREGRGFSSAALSCYRPYALNTLDSSSSRTVQRVRAYRTKGLLFGGVETRLKPRPSSATRNWREMRANPQPKDRHLQ